MRFGYIILAAVFFLGACGSSTGDRAASGAGIGATAGAVVGAVTGLSILQGVVIGGVAGGVVGGVTDESQIDLGDPIWANDDQPANSAAVGRVQAGLTQLGYDPGPIDGTMGGQTRSAIESYQRDHGLLVDGRASAQLAQHIDDQLEVAGG
jgi:peptidoglycan hydrolase-like protein with peptidoglycan-binding domain